MNGLNGGNVKLAQEQDSNGWWVLLDEDNKPFLTVRTHPWALLMVELINNRGSEPEDE
jgi:hypothetical protein